MNMPLRNIKCIYANEHFTQLKATLFQFVRNWSQSHLRLDADEYYEMQELTAGKIYDDVCYVIDYGGRDKTTKLWIIVDMIGWIYHHLDLDSFFSMSSKRFMTNNIKLSNIYQLFENRWMSLLDIRTPTNVGVK